MTIPRNFRNTQEAAIISYNFTDIAEGTGNIIFNLFSQSTDVGTVFGLSTQAVRSEDIELTGNAARDFELSPFNAPQIISGVAVFEGVIRTTGSGNIKYTISIKKNSDVLVTEESRTETATGTSHNFVVPIIIPKTKFKKGDVLKVNVTAAGGAVTYMGADPTNRDGAQITAANGGYTNTRITIPFDLDL